MWIAELYDPELQGTTYSCTHFPVNHARHNCPEQLTRSIESISTSSVRQAGSVGPLILPQLTGSLQGLYPNWCPTSRMMTASDEGILDPTSDRTPTPSPYPHPTSISEPVPGPHDPCLPWEDLEAPSGIWHRLKVGGRVGGIVLEAPYCTLALRPL